MVVVFTESLEVTSVLGFPPGTSDSVRLQRGDEAVIVDVLLTTTGAHNDTVLLRPRPSAPGLYRVVVSEAVQRADATPLARHYEAVFEVR